MRSRYASSVMVGILRAWKVKVLDGLERAENDAEVRSLG